MALLFIAPGFGNTESVTESLTVFLYSDNAVNGLCSNAQPLNNAKLKKMLLKKGEVIEAVPIPLVHLGGA